MLQTWSATTWECDQLSKLLYKIDGSTMRTHSSELLAASWPKTHWRSPLYLIIICHVRRNVISMSTICIYNCDITWLIVTSYMVHNVLWHHMIDCDIIYGAQCIVTSQDWLWHHIWCTMYCYLSTCYVFVNKATWKSGCVNHAGWECVSPTQLVIVL